MLQFGVHALRLRARVGARPSAAATHGVVPLLTILPLALLHNGARRQDAVHKGQSKGRPATSTSLAAARAAAARIVSLEDAVAQAWGAPAVSGMSSTHTRPAPGIARRDAMPPAGGSSHTPPARAHTFAGRPGPHRLEPRAGRDALGDAAQRHEEAPDWRRSRAPASGQPIGGAVHGTGSTPPLRAREVSTEGRGVTNTGAQNLPPHGVRAPRDAPSFARAPAEHSPPAHAPRVAASPRKRRGSLARYTEPPQSVSVRTLLPPVSAPDARSLNVAVVGAPNAGKSTLVNRLCGQKVSAASPKYNTTRDRVLGVHTAGKTQLVFYDTPGFLSDADALSGRYIKSLVTAAKDAVPESDVVLFVVDTARRWDDDGEQARALRELANLCHESGTGLLLVANKVDLMRGAHVSSARLRTLSRLATESAATHGRWTHAHAPTPDVNALHANDTWAHHPMSATATAQSALDAAGVAISGEQDAPRLAHTTASASDLWRLPPAPSVHADAASAASQGSGKAHPVHPDDAAMQAHVEPGVAHATSLSSDVSGEAQALGVKLDMLYDAFEDACYRAGIISSMGFDAPAGNSAQERSEAAVAGSSSDGMHAPPPTAAIYKWVPPIFPVAALMGEGTSELLTALQRLAVPRPWDYHASTVTDLSPTERLAEVVREKLFLHLHREAPYAVSQRTRSWADNAAGELVIHHDLVVPRSSIASMLLVRKGAPLKAISMAAIADLEKMFKRKVHLFLNVSVKEPVKR